IPNGWERTLQLMLEGTDWATVFVFIAQTAAAAARFTPTQKLLTELRHAHPDRCIVLVGPADESVRQALEREGIVIMSEPSRAVTAAGAAAAIAERWSRLDETALKAD